MQSWRQCRLFSRTYLLFFVLTLRDYLTQGASHTIQFMLMLGICCMTVDKIRTLFYHNKKISIAGGVVPGFA